MPTNRRRRTHVRRSTIADWHRAFVEAGMRAPEHGVAILQLLADYYRGGRRLERLWQSLRKSVLADWQRVRPGTRPWAWWLFDAPRDKALAARVPGWARGRAIDHRRQVSGCGAPAVERFPGLVPRFVDGAPATWLDVDPLDPPRVESQAAYLDRHGLLGPLERPFASLAPVAITAAPAPGPEDRWPAFTHRADLYARDVVAGRVIAGPLVRAACERHLRDRERAASADGHPFSCWFDEEMATLWLDWFELVMKLPDMTDEDGEGIPFTLHPSQAFQTGAMFGWIMPDGARRFREAYLEMGKGSGKSPWLASIGVGLMVIDGERAAEIYSGAKDKNQAKVLFRDAERMVKASPQLRGLLRRSLNRIEYSDELSFFEPISSEPGSKSGPRPHGGLIDELHEHPDGVVVNKVRAGAKRRKQPYFIEITNAGFDRTSICWAHHEHSRKILEGIIPDERWFAFVCSLDEGDDPLKDPACWPKTNPLLGITPSLEYLQRQVQNAINIPAETNAVLRLNFCVWTQAIARFLPPGTFAACSASVPDEELEQAPCFAGVDLGQTDDMSAFARTWWFDDGRVVVRMRYWIPESALREHPNRPYEEWLRTGLLKITEGNDVDYTVVEREIYDLSRESRVLEVACDKRFAGQMMQNLMGDGINCVDQPQGFFLNEAIRKLSVLVKAALLCHGGDPILTWMADNVVTRTGPHGLRLDKEKSKEKIDGIAALCNAIARAILQTVQESAYADHGLMVV